jgi:hypothetical protein
MSPISGILISAVRPTGRAKKCVDAKSAPYASTQQAEQASFTREKIPRRASQFFLTINKKTK